MNTSNDIHIAVHDGNVWRTNVVLKNDARGYDEQ